MAEEDQAQRTEPATPRRREEARRKGQVAQSRELPSVAVMGAALLALLSPLGSELGETLLLGLRQGFTQAGDPPSTLTDFHAALLGSIAPAAAALAPIVLLASVLGALMLFVQIGPLFHLEILMPRFERLDPIQGAKRLVNLDRLFDLAKSLFKVAAVGIVATLVLMGEADAVLGLFGSDLASAIGLTGRLALRLAACLLGLLGVLALLDLVYQRWRHEERLKMSKRDVRDELRQREGDPLLRGRFRALHRELSRSRMIAAVAEADVVVTNPTHYAVALRYDRTTMAAPHVLAKGRDRVAERIRAAATEHGVPIVENPPLARVLERTAEVGREIPENLFQAVAEVLAYVYRLQPQRAHRWGVGS